MLARSKHLLKAVRNFGVSWEKQLNTPLRTEDPEIFDIIEKEKLRQWKGLQLIPSENFAPQAVLDAVGSVLMNKYSEGLPGQRYYGGNEFIDASERLCQKRALAAFHLDPKAWGVNVQSLSGSPANLQAYNAVLEPHDRILSLDLPHGGHLSHGYQIPGKKISAVSKFYETLPYRLDEKTGTIDYAQMEYLFDIYRPKVVVAGASSYPRLIDYKRMKAMCLKTNAYLMSDMAHISGLVAAKLIPSPFDYSDIVTTTTHKTLRGPRGGLIFFRKGPRKMTKNGKITTDENYDLESRINQSVFPGLQGGPHNHTIAGIAVALKMATTTQYKEYQTQVLKNNKALARAFTERGFSLVSGGTDNHLILVDLRKKGIDGGRVERVLELCGIAVNKNTVPGDKSALLPGGIRLGTPAITTRGFKEADMEVVVDFIMRGIDIAITIKDATKGGKLADFKDEVNKDVTAYGMGELKAEVEKFSLKQYCVGFDHTKMKYKP